MQNEMLTPADAAAYLTRNGYPVKEATLAYKYRTVSTFHQPEGLLSIYDPGTPHVAPDVSTPARKAAVAVEDRIRQDTLESGAFFDANGAQLLLKQGRIDMVGFTHAELDQVAKASLFTHNHPNGAPFSLQDIGAAFGTELQELRVVTRYARYTMLASRRGWQRVDVLALALTQAGDGAMEEVRNAVVSGELHISQYGNEVRHRAWQKVAGWFGFTYRREAS